MLSCPVQYRPLKHDRGHDPILSLYHLPLLVITSSGSLLQVEALKRIDPPQMYADEYWLEL